MADGRFMSLETGFLAAIAYHNQRFFRETSFFAYVKKTAICHLKSTIKGGKE
jgi:hypothetical protein